MPVRFEWDEAKRLANIRKHGLDFVGIEEVFEGPTFTFEDDRLEYSETRLVTFGFWKGRVVAVVHTESQDAIRIISIRKASKHETKDFFSQIGHGLGTN